VIVAALLLGLFSIWQTPREEEPQIVVPMLGCVCEHAGRFGTGSRAARNDSDGAPVKRSSWCRVPLFDQPAGWCTGHCPVYVGIKEEDAIVRTYNKLYANFDCIPQGASQPLIKARSIDDVPVLAMTFWGKNHDGATLRRIAAEVHRASSRWQMYRRPRCSEGQKRD